MWKFVFKICVLVMASTHFCFGQQLRYTTHTQAMISGYNPLVSSVGYGFQTFHGLDVNDTYQFGIVGGFDEYSYGEMEEKYRTIPLTLRIERNFSMRGHNKIFVAADGGYAFSIKPDASTDAVFYTNYKGGSALELSAGFKLKMTEKLFWSAGLGYRTVGFKTDGVISRWGNTVIEEKNDYRLHRILLKIGLGF